MQCLICVCVDSLRPLHQQVIREKELIFQQVLFHITSKRYSGSRMFLRKCGCERGAEMGNAVVTFIMVLYMAFMLYIGWRSSKKIKNTDDFLLAGRNLGVFVLAGTLAATEIGGSSCLGVVEQAYGEWGMSAMWYLVSKGICFVILALFCVKFRRAKVRTVPEYYRRRYGRKAGLITAIVMGLPFINLTAGQVVASAAIISVLLGVDYTLSIIIVAIIVTVYSVMGGLWSVSITDTVQVLFIVVGMVIAIPFALQNVGGWGNVVSNVPPEVFSLTGGMGVMSIISLVVMYTASFAVGQEAVSRYYAAKDEKTAIRGSIVAAAIYFIFALIPTLLGIITLATVNAGQIDASLILQDGAKYALPNLAMQTMPPVITGLLFAGIISATMSSADSNLLGGGSIFANDIYKVYIKPDASSEETVKVTRISMIVICILSMFFAYKNDGPIVEIFVAAFTLRAAGAFVPYILGHYWKKASAAGSIASIIGGSVVVIAMDWFGLNLWNLDPIIPALIVSTVAFFLFSYLFPVKQETLELASEDDPNAPAPISISPDTAVL